MTFVLISHFLPTNFLLINVINSQSLPTELLGKFKIPVPIHYNYICDQNVEQS